MAIEAFGPDREIRVGIIGTGTISRSHANSLLDCANVELAVRWRRGFRRPAGGRSAM